MPTFLTIESSTYKAGSFRGAGTYKRIRTKDREVLIMSLYYRNSTINGESVRHNIKAKEQKNQTHISDMIFQNPGDSHGVLCIFLSDDGKVSDLVLVVMSQIFEGMLVVFSDFIGRQS